MNNAKKTGIALLFGLLTTLNFTNAYANEKAHVANDHEEVPSLINITPEGQKSAGIKVSILEKHCLSNFISAPGEVIPSANESAIVTPRVRSQVIARLVQIGEKVKKGQPLVTLSSVEVANAQAAMLLAKNEWERVKNLGTNVISTRAHQAAKIKYQEQYARLLAYGIAEQQIKTFLKSGDPKKANGEFTLLAPRSGTIFDANFVIGQMIDPATELTPLYRIVNESSLWVDAQLSDGEGLLIKQGADVIIKTNRAELKAHVLYLHHRLDEITRTQVVRIEVSNLKDLLHPGQFVTAIIKVGETSPQLAVPNEALVRTPNGDQAVYVEEKPNYFKAMEVEVKETIGNWTVINGIEVGKKIVTQGAFFVHSEALKSGFSIHNH